MTSSLLDAVPEAPVDTKQYARKDGDWSEVDASVLDHNNLNGLNVGDYEHWTAVEKAAIVINPSAPASTITIDASGNIVFGADFKVEGTGTRTVLNTQTLEIEDKNIEIAKVGTPTDITADGGGITLKGTTDKTINWLNTDDRWHFNQGIEIDSGDLVINAGGNLLINSKNVEDHIDSVLNPHSVTKIQVGLSNVDNTADVDKIHNNFSGLNDADFKHWTAAEKAAITINATAPAQSIDIDASGNVTVLNNFTVSGSQTILNTQTLEIEDKNIELAKVTTPTDITADGGGITLKGTTDKTIIWDNTTDLWQFNQGIAVLSGKVGIGKSDPAEKLEVEGTGNIMVVSRSLSSGNAYFTADSSLNAEALVDFLNGGVRAWIYGNYGIGGSNIFNIRTGDFSSAKFVILPGGNIGFSEINPETALEITNANPYITLHNSTHEDIDGGRESQLLFKGEQSGGEETTLAKIEASHDGSGDNERGILNFYVNSGVDGNDLQQRMWLDSNGQMTIEGTGVGNTMQFTINTLDENTQSLLRFTEDGTTKWQLASRNQIDTPNDRLSLFNTSASEVFTVLQDGGILMYNLKSGATQGAAGATANELWITSGHATQEDNTIMIGV